MQRMCVVPLRYQFKRNKTVFIEFIIDSPPITKNTNQIEKIKSKKNFEGEMYKLVRRLRNP